MTKKYNAPVAIQVYLGSGEAGAKLRENLQKKVQPNGSLSEVIVSLLRKADPTLFKGVENGKRA